MKAFSIVIAAAMATACSGPAPDTSDDGNATSVGSVEHIVAPSATPTPRDYAGRWVGVEGMYLDIAHAGAPGHYDLTMRWDLDNKGIFDGTINGRTITFVRNDIVETLRPTDGDATGLKYLAGKTDCLTVKPGEGYCRDGLSR